MHGDVGQFTNKEEIMINSFLKKNTDWAYEQEYRIVVSDEMLIKNPIKINLDEINEIIFGLMVEDNEKCMLIKLINNVFSNIDLYKVVRGEGKNAIERKKIT